MVAGAPRPGNSAQPAAIRIGASQRGSARIMWVVYLEMGVAFALLILIIWWTLPSKRKDDEDRKK